MTTLRQAVFPTERQALYERGHYSPAIRSNGFLFISGQVGSREDGSPEPDLEQQIRLAFENLHTVLAAAGCSFAHVLDVTLFLWTRKPIWKPCGRFCRTTGGMRLTRH